jgi:hypothetical protein
MPDLTVYKSTQHLWGGVFIGRNPIFSVKLRHIRDE